MSVTEKQVAVFDFIRDYYRQHGFMPATGEIADAFGLQQVSISHHLKILHREGWITFGGHPRQIDVSHDGAFCLRCGQPNPWKERPIEPT